MTGSVFDADNDVYVPIRGTSLVSGTKILCSLILEFIQIVYRDWILSTYLDIQNATNQSNSEAP